MLRSVLNKAGTHCILLVPIDLELPLGRNCIPPILHTRSDCITTIRHITSARIQASIWPSLDCVSALSTTKVEGTTLACDRQSLILTKQECDVQRPCTLCVRAGVTCAAPARTMTWKVYEAGRQRRRLVAESAIRVTANSPQPPERVCYLKGMFPEQIAGSLGLCGS